MDSIVKRLLENHQKPVRLTEGKELTLEINDPDGNIIGLLQTISEYANRGHSFRVVVDPGDEEYTKEFWIDGDGSDKLYLEEEI